MLSGNRHELCSECQPQTRSTQCRHVAASKCSLVYSTSTHAHPRFVYLYNTGLSKGTYLCNYIIVDTIEYGMFESMRHRHFVDTATKNRICGNSIQNSYRAYSSQYSYSYSSTPRVRVYVHKCVLYVKPGKHECMTDARINTPSSIACHSNNNNNNKGV